VLDSKSTTEEEVKRTKRILEEYHRVVFKAMVVDGLIHSDIHLGNAVRSTHPNGEGFSLFDVGQFERIGPADTKAILWVLAAMSSVSRRKILMSTAISHMAGCSKLLDPDDQGGFAVSPRVGSGSRGEQHSSNGDFSAPSLSGSTASCDLSSPRQSKAVSKQAVTPAEAVMDEDLAAAATAWMQIKASNSERSAGNVAAPETAEASDSSAAAGMNAKLEAETIKKRLRTAFCEAVAPNANGELPDQRTAYMLFLRAAEAHKVGLPSGAFAVAKMIDGMLSQQENYALEPVVEQELEAFLKRNISWFETASITTKTVTSALGL